MSDYVEVSLIGSDDREVYATSACPRGTRAIRYDGKVYIDMSPIFGFHWPSDFRVFREEYRIWDAGGPLDR